MLMVASSFIFHALIRIGIKQGQRFLCMIRGQVVQEIFPHHLVLLAVKLKLLFIWDLPFTFEFSAY